MYRINTLFFSQKNTQPLAWHRVFKIKIVESHIPYISISFLDVDETIPCEPINIEKAVLSLKYMD